MTTECFIGCAEAVFHGSEKTNEIAPRYTSVACKSVKKHYLIKCNLKIKTADLTQLSPQEKVGSGLELSTIFYSYV